MSAWTDSTINLPIDNEKYFEKLDEKTGGILIK
jgi:hypothetical protein